MHLAEDCLITLAMAQGRQTDTGLQNAADAMHRLHRTPLRLERHEQTSKIF